MGVFLWYLWLIFRMNDIWWIYWEGQRWIWFIPILIVSNWLNRQSHNRKLIPLFILIVGQFAHLASASSFPLNSLSLFLPSSDRVLDNRISHQLSQPPLTTQRNSPWKFKCSLTLPASPLTTQRIVPLKAHQLSHPLAWRFRCSRKRICWWMAKI